MLTVTLPNRSTHPPIGAWVWGNQGIAYQVTRRFTRSGQYWLTLATDSGPVEMPLSRVVGWAASPPSPGEAQPPEPPTYQRGEPIEIYFPHRGEWWGGFRYLKAHKNPERCWLTDSQGIEHSSLLKFVRKVIR